MKTKSVSIKYEPNTKETRIANLLDRKKYFLISNIFFNRAMKALENNKTVIYYTKDNGQVVRIQIKKG